MIDNTPRWIKIGDALKAAAAELGLREAWRLGPNGLAALLLSIYPQRQEQGVARNG